jgi:hypothetical protein
MYPNFLVSEEPLCGCIANKSLLLLLLLLYIIRWLTWCKLFQIKYLDFDFERPNIIPLLPHLLQICSSFNSSFHLNPTSLYIYSLFPYIAYLVTKHLKSRLWQLYSNWIKSWMSQKAACSIFTYVHQVNLNC